MSRGENSAWCWLIKIGNTSNIYSSWLEYIWIQASMRQCGARCGANSGLRIEQTNQQTKHLDQNPCSNYCCVTSSKAPNFSESHYLIYEKYVY